ncbi:MAG: chalcone isomerase family protein [Rubrivivax sp.]|nr:chalcone isomerase family protein [Rubrivivax sp.]
MNPVSPGSINRRRLLRRAAAAVAAVAAVAVAAPGARAATFEGVQFEDRITLAGQALVLNGTGLRAAGWFKAYVAALYLARPARTAAEVLQQPGPKRVRLVLLVDAPAVELAKGFDKGVLKNCSPAETEALQARLARMFEWMQSAGSLKSGDAIDLDFNPAQGTTLLLNGRPRGEPIPGADFYAAVLRSFVGDRPYHKKLRAGMLGTPA